MASTISSELSAGALSGTDATALTSALTAIDTGLSASSSGKAAGGAATARDPASLTDRIDGLIADQVSAGTLTDDQAGALKSLFASGGQSTRASQADGAREAGGPPPGPPPDGAASGSDDGTTNGSATRASVSDLLSSFIKQLQSVQATGSAYGANGTNRTSSASSALVLDTSA
ncbi:hypothetical protein ASG51_00170 [Methylobacterium sp. Leaf465]|uniref:hypothetical protein n=1 Tax=Methylobacterium sp. Leaf465 TaxID=1736385 RepID=UPI0006FDF446|nr:hypothetical protein [Methylobacterium sp. Leaf465]KQT85010.1 hypothetical protein ASG51_00170 [Methylobacterium sp. Leaf465]